MFSVLVIYSSILLYLFVPSHELFSFPQFARSSSDAILGDFNSPFPMERNEIWTASPFLSNEWVICGSALSGRDKVVLGYLIIPLHTIT
jgi:BRCA1-associated RING domain protein 1